MTKFAYMNRRLSRGIYDSYRFDISVDVAAAMYFFYGVNHLNLYKKSTSDFIIFFTNISTATSIVIFLPSIFFFVAKFFPRSCITMKFYPAPVLSTNSYTYGVCSNPIIIVIYSEFEQIKLTHTYLE